MNIIRLIQKELDKRCCCNPFGITSGEPTEAPQNSQQVLFDPSANIWYRYSGGAWVEIPSGTESAFNGVTVDSGNVVLGDDAEGTTEPGAITSDRYLNLDGNDLIFVGENADGRPAYVKINSLGQIEVYDPVPDSVTEGYRALVLKHRQTHANAVDFIIAHNTVVNTDGNLNNEVVRIGWNMDLAAAGKTGLGWEIENHYQPTPGDDIAELHLVFYDKLGVGHRLESYTINKDLPATWDKYNTIGINRFVNPVDNGNYAYIRNQGTTGSDLLLLGSATGTGVEFFVDASSTNLQILPLGFVGSNKYVYLDGWNAVGLPALSSNNIGSKYNVFTGKLVPDTDNTKTIGENGARFSDVEACAVKITDPASYANVFFEVTDAGAVYLHNAPIHADETAAAAAGLTSGRVYKTVTGQLMVKA